MATIGIIVGTTRDTRFADKPAAWIHAFASARGDFAYELVDLRDYPMPFFDEPASNARVPSRDEVALRWQRKLAELDGFIVLAAEYNHGPAAVLKNAFDYAAPEWARKPIAFVGYGGCGGARAIEQLRQIAVALEMAPVAHAVHLMGSEFMAAWRGGKSLDEVPFLPQLATAMLDDMAWWVRALKAAREAAPATSAPQPRSA